jgi:tetratricopeptide (TPR) repeat protein
MLLERARALHPDSAEALEGLQAIATEAADFERLAEVLERKLAVVARGPVEKKEILVKLAEIYDGPLARPDRARATHERALEIDPDFAASRLWLGRDAWARGDAAAAARDIARALETAPGGTAAIDLLANDEALSAAVATERARLRLAGPGGAPAALEVLRAIPPATLGDEGLVLRADLGEREHHPTDALPALEELRSRARGAGHATGELNVRIRALAGDAPEREVPSVEELERQLLSDPANDATAEALAGRYAALADPTHRAEALAGLLSRVPGLSPERRKTLYATVGESAEAGGDLERAEQAYWRAAQIEAEPALRANYLAGHARMLLARGDLDTAIGELESALASAPAHAGALVLLADISFRTQNWDAARELYDALEATAEAPDVIPRAELVHRRAVLAHRAGDTLASEALFRELAILNPTDADARRALAELARARGELSTSALRLEEVLRLLPPGALGELADVRQRLGTIYAEMGEWELARTTMELVLGHDANRAQALEILIDAYEKLELPAAAAEACERLSRITAEPSRRASALYRQAEILRIHLDDAAGALDAYLRSSDLDPGFLPARLRLVDHFWRAGDLDVVADLAGDLRSVPFSPEGSADLVVRLGIAGAPPRTDRSARSPFASSPVLAPAAARALADAAGREELDARGIGALDPMLTRARGWAGTGEAALVRALIDLVLEHPTDAGPALALGRLAELAGRRALAGAAYGLTAFMASDGVGARQLAGLVPPGLVRPEAVRIGGPVDHPDFAGPARRALARLAPALLGFETERPAPKPTEGSGLPPARAAELRRIGDLLGAPPFVVAPDVVETDTADDRRRLRVILTQPAGLLVAAGAGAVSEHAWSFIAARALETLRSGLWMAGLAGAEGLARLLEGARAVLSEARVDEPRARAVAEWLSKPEVALFLGPAEERVETLAAVEAALAALPDWTALTRAAQHTRNRIGLIGCADPSAALGMLKAEDRNAGSVGDSPDARREFLRRAATSDLVRFMFSPTYESAFS